MVKQTSGFATLEFILYLKVSTAGDFCQETKYFGCFSATQHSNGSPSDGDVGL